MLTLARRKQEGVVLIMALIVLVALTLAALALTRSTYTSNAIAGNMAFQQATTHSADEGVEAAIAWLENNNGALMASCATGGAVLDCDQTPQGYLASRQPLTAGESWTSYWARVLAGSAQPLNGGTPDSAGNTVSYVIQRMCSSAGDSQSTSNDCTISPTASASTCAGGSSCDAGQVNMNAPTQVYYRITVKVSGPRNTQSYVQAMVAM